MTCSVGRGRGPRLCAGLVLGAALAAGLVGLRPVHGGESKLDEALRGVEIPPGWFADAPITYDTKKPWKDARIHIRQLLSKGKNRDAIRLTYDYLIERKVQENTHEYGMYLFLGGEYAWATRVYMERLRDRPKGHIFDYKALASLYTRLGAHAKAIAVLETALERLPDPPWAINAQANVHDKMGDVYADMGEVEKAREHYAEAIRVLPTSKQPYGRHLLHRQVAKTQAKLDLLNRKALDIRAIRDGVYRGQSLGYGKPVHATVTVKGGRITDVQIQHQEKIEQGATRIIPEQIIERQGLEVDAITGATVTVQAIVEATYRALQKGGLK